MTKSDFLKECMSDVSSALGKIVPIDEFNQEFCVLCINKECARSRSNNLLFEQRAINWKNSLFKKIPRANETDPKYASIRSKNFTPITPPESDTIVKPQVDVVENTFDKSDIIQRKMKIEFKSESEPEPAELELDEPQPVTPPAPAPEPEPQIQPNVENTPFAQGTTLPGRKKEIVLEPGQSGQSYTFGSDDETS